MLAPAVVVGLLVSLGPSGSGTAADARTTNPAEEPRRFEVLFAAGERISGEVPQLGAAYPFGLAWQGRPLFLDGVGPRWIGRADLARRGPSRPTGLVELHGGDVVPGEILEFVPGGPEADPVPFRPDHLLVRCDAWVEWPTLDSRKQHATYDAARVLRVAPGAVRRFARRRDDGRRLPPGAARLTDGRRLEVRAARWREGGVELLTPEGTERVRFAEIDALHLPNPDPWEAWFEIRAALAFDGAERLVRYRTQDGLCATTAAEWYQVPLEFEPSPSRVPVGQRQPTRYLRVVRPAWSADVLWLDPERIADRIEFGADEVPLSCLAPDRFEQQSGIGAAGRWATDASIRGKALRCGRAGCGWGFGVHGGTVLEFPLHPAVRTFAASVGIDADADGGGYAQASVHLLRGDEPPRTLYESAAFDGRDGMRATGPLAIPAADDGAPWARLVLRTRAEPEAPRAGADPADIRDFVDWLEPVLRLDPAAIPEVGIRTDDGRDDPPPFGRAESPPLRDRAAVWPVDLLRVRTSHAYSREDLEQVLEGFRLDVPFHSTDPHEPRRRHLRGGSRFYGGPFAILPAQSDGIPVLLRRAVDVPREGTTRLEATVMSAARADWRLVVSAEGRVLLDRTIPENRSAATWLPVSVDLTPFAGRRTMLEIANFGTNRHYSEARIKRLEIVTTAKP